MGWGLAAGCVAVVFYAVSTVLQAVAARQADQPATVGAVTSLVRRPSWWAGMGCLAVGFLCFAVSTQLLSLPVAEAIRSSFVVFAVLLGHLVFRTRASALELFGVVVAIASSVAFVVLAGGRGSDEPPAALPWIMTGGLAAIVVLALGVRHVAQRGSIDPRLVGLCLAALAGFCFSLLALGLRSLQSLTHLLGVLTTPEAWVGGAAALCGLVLFAGAVVATTLALATTVMVVVEAVSAALAAALAFGDAAGTAPGVWLGCGLGVAFGAGLVGVSAGRSSPDHNQPRASGPISAG